ncbi:MAG TPA: C-GCAxxG-C-C family protein [Bacteroidales bacterium]
MKNNGKINRRNFLKLSALGAGATGAALVMANFDKLFTSASARKGTLTMAPGYTKKVFSKCGTCSQTFLYVLNREFGYPGEIEERASDPLAGGLMNTQHQCGMLWGSALAAGAESYRMCNDQGKAIGKAITASQYIVESFSKRAKTVNCRDIIGFDMSDKLNMAKFMIKALPGGFTNMICMDIAEKWAPEAIESATVGLDKNLTDLPPLPVSCASEVAKKMGAGDKEIVTVAGLAGGLGLSGNGCGALSAAIWISSLDWCKKHPGESGYLNPKSKEILKAFYNATGSEMVCSKITGQQFRTITDHTEFIKSGGCNKLIQTLAQA